MKSITSAKFFALALLLTGSFAAHAKATESVLIVAADGSNYPTTQLLGLDGITTVSVYNSASGTPTLAQLSGYDAVLAYTDSGPASPAGLGNVLEQYVNGGGTLVLGTYGISTPWEITGGIMTAGYSPLLDSGVNGSTSGHLVATVPSDAIFDGVNLSALAYFNNGNFAKPTLASGATLLATDGNGVDMIAVNAAGNVYTDNLFPSTQGNSNNGQVYQLIANELTGNGPRASVPDAGSTALLFGLGGLGLALSARKRAARNHRA